MPSVVGSRSSRLSLSGIDNVLCTMNMLPTDLTSATSVCALSAAVPRPDGGVSGRQGGSPPGHTSAVPMRDEDKEAVRRFAAWKHRRREPGSGNVDSASPQDVYADLMRNAFAPALREAGLRGSNGRFELPSEVYWAQLGFQKSAYSSADEVRFTVNLSVIRRDEWTLQSTAKPYLGKRPRPSTHYGTWADQVR